MAYSLNFNWNNVSAPSLGDSINAVNSANGIFRNNALDFNKMASDIRDYQKDQASAQLFRDATKAADVMDPNSLNAWIANHSADSAYTNVDQEAWKYLGSLYRSNVNKELDESNLRLAKKAMAKDQLLINSAHDTPSAKLANYNALNNAFNGDTRLLRSDALDLADTAGFRQKDANIAQTRAQTALTGASTRRANLDYAEESYDFGRKQAKNQIIQELQNSAYFAQNPEEQQKVLQDLSNKWSPLGFGDLVFAAANDLKNQNPIYGVGNSTYDISLGTPTFNETQKMAKAQSAAQQSLGSTYLSGSGSANTGIPTTGTPGVLGIEPLNTDSINVNATSQKRPTLQERISQLEGTAPQSSAKTSAVATPSTTVDPFTYEVNKALESAGYKPTSTPTNSVTKKKSADDYMRDFGYGSTQDASANTKSAQAATPDTTKEQRAEAYIQNLLGNLKDVQQNSGTGQKEVDYSYADRIIKEALESIKNNNLISNKSTLTGNDEYDVIPMSAEAAGIDVGFSIANPKQARAMRQAVKYKQQAEEGRQEVADYQQQIAEIEENARSGNICALGMGLYRPLNSDDDIEDVSSHVLENIGELNQKMSEAQNRMNHNIEQAIRYHKIGTGEVYSITGSPDGDALLQGYTQQKVNNDNAGTKVQSNVTNNSNYSDINAKLVDMANGGNNYPVEDYVNAIDTLHTQKSDEYTTALNNINIPVPQNKGETPNSINGNIIYAIKADPTGFLGIKPEQSNHLNDVAKAVADKTLSGSPTQEELARMSELIRNTQQKYSNLSYAQIGVALLDSKEESNYPDIFNDFDDINFNADHMKDISRTLKAIDSAEDSPAKQAFKRYTDTKVKADKLNTNYQENKSYLTEMQELANKVWEMQHNPTGGNPNMYIGEANRITAKISRAMTSYLNKLK